MKGISSTASLSSASKWSSVKLASSTLIRVRTYRSFLTCQGKPRKALLLKSCWWSRAALECATKANFSGFPSLPNPWRLEIFGQSLSLNGSAIRRLRKGSDLWLKIKSITSLTLQMLEPTIRWTQNLLLTSLPPGMKAPTFTSWSSTLASLLIQLTPLFRGQTQWFSLWWGKSRDS